MNAIGFTHKAWNGTAPQPTDERRLFAGECRDQRDGLVGRGFVDPTAVASLLVGVQHASRARVRQADALERIDVLAW
ncbi:hypothetical protein ACFQMM_15760 [Saliphagus sp. GCM10025308]